MIVINVEQGFVSKLIETGNMKIVTEEQVKPQLLSGTYRTIFKYITDYHLEYGEVPDLQVVQRYYPDFKPVKTSKRQPLKWFINELRHKARHNMIADMMEKCYEYMELKETDKAEEELRKVVSNINLHVMKSQDIELTQSGHDLKDEFDRLEKLGGMIGIPTLIKELDNCLKGLQKEQLITIMARLGVGKTWFLILLLVSIWKQGYDVALATTEMSVEMIRRRVVAMLYNIPYNQLRSGKMIIRDKKKYFRALDDLAKKKNKFYIFKATGGVSFIRSKLDQYKPDVFGLDGMYLIEDDRGSSEEHVRITHITRDLKNMANELKIPFVCTTQANRQTSKKTGPEVDNISYSDSVGQDSDVVIALNQTDEMRNDHEMMVRVLKQREGNRLALTMNWDFKEMKFESLYGEVEGGEEDDDKEVKKNKSGKGTVVGINELGLKKALDDDETDEDFKPKKKKIKPLTKSKKKKKKGVA